MATTDLWSVNAEKSLQGHAVPVERIGIDDLDAMTVDWSSYDVVTAATLTSVDQGCQDLVLALRIYLAVQQLAANRSEVPAGQDRLVALPLPPPGARGPEGLELGDDHDRLLDLVIGRPARTVTRELISGRRSQRCAR